jgi:hypothetical protein
MRSTRTRRVIGLTASVVAAAASAVLLLAPSASGAGHSLAGHSLNSVANADNLGHSL